jgi:hypothetical protein
VLLTVAIQFVLALMIVRWSEPGLHNLVWILGVPALIGIAAFKTDAARAAAVVALIAVGLLAMMAAAFFLPAGYR